MRFTFMRSAFIRFTLPALFAVLALVVLTPVSAGAEQISIGTSSRSYELFRPVRQVATRQYLPLIVVLHETGGSAARLQRSLGLDVVASREGFAVAYAEALNGNWNDGRLAQTSQKEQAGGDDVRFIHALVQHLNGRGIGRAGEVALVGVDGGGMMVYRMACESSGVFSSYAALLANMPIELRQKCQAAERKPMLILSGTSDTIMPFDGGKLAKTTGLVQSADTTFQYWGQVNGCSAGEVVTLPDTDKNDGTRIEMIAAQTCAQNADTLFYRVLGGGHQLPTRTTSQRIFDRVEQKGGDKAGGRVSHDLDTAELLWQFASGQRP